MGHKVFISFKAEDHAYKDAIQSFAHLDYVDKSLNEPINSENEDYILQKIRDEYLRDSTVTVFVIGQHSNENLGSWEQRYIKRELQASLYNGKNNTKNGILGVVLPSVSPLIFKGKQGCLLCGGDHTIVVVSDSTVVKEFSANYYIPHDKCAWAEEDRYCVLVGWEDFKADPNNWIDRAFAKRTAPIAAKTKVYPK